MLLPRVRGRRATIPGAGLQVPLPASQNADVVVALQDTDDRGMLHLFVKVVLQAAMERSFRERELASKLLVALVPDPISHEQVPPPPLPLTHLSLAPPLPCPPPSVLAFRCPSFTAACPGSSSWRCTARCVRGCCSTRSFCET